MIAESLRFILESDKVKAVERRTSPVGLTRKENPAEHSWSLALMAMTLIPAVNPSLDTLRVLEMLILHDLVEIDAGDTFCYGEQGDKKERELAAAGRLFGLLPAATGQSFHSLWREFEDATTPEAIFANAMDRLLPLLQNHANGGGSWIEFGVTLEQVLERNRGIESASPELWSVVKSLAAAAADQCWLKVAPSNSLSAARPDAPPYLPQCPDEDAG